MKLNEFRQWLRDRFSGPPLPKQFQETNEVELAQIVAAQNAEYTERDKDSARAELSDVIRDRIPIADAEVERVHAKTTKQTPEMVAQMKAEGHNSLMAASGHVFDMWNDPAQSGKLHGKRPRQTYTAEELGLLRETDPEYVEHIVLTEQVK